MALFSCIVAASTNGVLSVTEVPAASPGHVDKGFLDKGITPPLAVRADEQLAELRDELADKRIKLKNRRAVLGYLQGSAEMRFPVSRALQIAQRSMSARRAGFFPDPLPKILERITKRVTQGSRLAEVLELYPGFADEATIGIVAAGEGSRRTSGSGDLAESFKQAGLLLDQQIRFITAIKRALIYPMILVLFACGLVTFLMIKVIPTFLDIFSELKAELPWETRLMRDVSIFCQEHWILLIVGLALAVFSTRYLGPLARWFRWWQPQLVLRWHTFLLRVKGLGHLLRLNQEISLCRVIVALQRARQTQSMALALGQGLSGNLAYRAALARLRKAVHGGDDIGLAFSREKAVFTPMFLESMLVASETSEVEGIMSKYLELAEREFQTASEAIQTFILPVVLLIVAVPIGLIASACMRPLFQMSDLIK